MGINIKARVRAFGKFILRNKQLTFYLLVLFIISLINTLHFYYPDEFDNILGGNYIIHGRLPYVGFFTDHGPVTYFYAAFIALFSGASFVRFRIFLAIFNFLFTLLFIKYLYTRFGKFELKVSLILLFFLTLGATYWWWHMLLADSFAGFMFLADYMILFFLFLKKESFHRKDLALVSLFTFLLLLTSLTYSYVVMILYFFIIFWYFKFNSFKDKKRILSFFSYLALPYLIFLMYLLITSSFSDYVYQSIVFIKDYYAKSVDGSTISNPFRHMLTIFSVFSDRYRAVLLGVKDLNLGDPIVSAFGISNLFLAVYLIIKKRFSLFLMIFLMAVYLNTRSNPFTTAETDYQGIPYVFFSFFNGVLIMILLCKELNEEIVGSMKSLFSTFLMLLFLFYFFSGWLLFNRAFDKAYLKYMGVKPLIYDRPAVAPMLNGLLSKSDYFYLGPFEFEEMLFMKAKPASKYIITLPEMDNSEKIKSELLSDLQKNRPKIVVFKLDDHIFGSYPGRFILGFLSENYFTLDELNKPQKIYNFKQPSFGRDGEYDFSRYFFFDKNRKDEILGQLKEQGYIIPVN